MPQNQQPRTGTGINPFELFMVVVTTVASVPAWLGRELRAHRCDPVWMRAVGLWLVQVIWLAGGGVRGGITHGATDDLGYNAVDDVVPVHDLHATMLHLLGIDHKRLTYKYQGRHFRLTDVHGEVVRKLLT